MTSLPYIPGTRLLLILLVAAGGVRCQNQQQSQNPQPGTCEPLPDPPGENVVNLAEKGLRPGEVIDPYLKKWVRDGNEVHVPAGTYRWKNVLSFVDLTDASIIGDGMVILRRPDTVPTPDLNLAPQGRFEVRNITIRGKAMDSTVRLYTTSSDGRLTIRNLNLPDGGSGKHFGNVGIFVNRRHEGTIWIIDTYVEGFSNNGLYASAPGQQTAGHGQVHVVRGLYKNNNISNVRIGSDSSSVVGTIIIQDSLAPRINGARNQRGLRVRQHATGRNIRIEDVDIVQRIGETNGALVVEGGEGGSGSITNVRIRNNVETAPIRIRPRGAQWNGSNIDITGNGTLQPYVADEAAASFSELCTGADCETPRTTQRAVCK